MATTTTHRRSQLDALADELTDHWNEVVAFVLNRRARASIYTGQAAELSPARLQAVLALADGDLKMGALAARLGLAESSVTRLVEGLEGLGLVERRMPVGDRRCVMVGLLGGGREVVRSVHRGRREFLREILQILGPKERRELVRLFGKLSSALGTQASRRSDDRGAAAS